MTGPAVGAAVAAQLEGLELDHVAVAVGDLDAGAAPFLLLGLEPAGDDEEPPGQSVRVRALRAGEALVELVAPTAETGPLAGFLQRRGPGLHHLALRVPALDDAVARLTAAGARFVDPTPHAGRAGSRVAFLHPSFGGGVLIELVER